MAKPVPKGLRTATISLCVSPCDQAIAIATRKENLTPQQVRERQKAFFASAQTRRGA